MALKIVKGKKVLATSKPAAAGSTKTGAKVEKTKSGKRTEGASAGRYTGKTTGMSVIKYQNQTIENNLKTKHDDETLAAMWRKEFPNAKADYTADTVRSVRSLVNRGRHGNNDGEPLPRPIPQFIDGEAQPFRGEKAAAARKRAAEKAGSAKKAKKSLKKGKK